MSLDRPTRSIHLLEFGSSHEGLGVTAQALRSVKLATRLFILKNCDYLALFFKMKVLKTVFRERFSRIFLGIVRRKRNITVLNNQGFAEVMGSLRCHNGDGNENFKKPHV